jgi:signal transduction histidine kinase
VAFRLASLIRPATLASVDSDPRAYPVLHRIASLVGRRNEPREVLRTILGTVIELFDAVSGTISLLNPDTGKLEIEVGQGLDVEQEDLSLRLGQGITGWVAFHARPLLVSDVSVEPRYVRVREDVRSEMAVPMLDPETGQVVGVINVDSSQLSGFSDRDLALFIRVGTEASAVMQRLWQLKHLQAKAQQLESLIAIGQSLVTKLEPQELFDTVTRDARQITQAHACALYLYDAAKAGVQLVSFSAPLEVQRPQGVLPLHSCLVASVVRTRKQVEFSNVQAPEFIDVIDLPRADGLRSMLAAPMLYESEVIGVLAVFTNHVHRFNNDEKRLLAALASLGTVALQNSRLYARVFQSEASLRKNEQLTTLGLLAAEIAHEIRNPLTVLKLLFGYLNLDFPEGDPRRTDVRVIGEKLDQLESIVSRVLNFAKAPSGIHSRWNVGDIIDDTLVLIRLKLAQGKIHLKYQPPPNTVVVDVQKGQLQQVLLNLLINATQAMPEGGSIMITCTTEDREGGPVVCIDVADTGTGIAPELRDHIFDSFLSGRPDGTGLGLAIAKRILASHHGDIQLRSTGPTGTTIRVVLPVARH